MTLFSMLSAYFVPIVVAVAVIVLLIVLLLLLGKKLREAGRRKAGKAGERVCLELLKSIARKEDLIFSNVELSYEGKRTELDCLVVNPHGIFIIEAKNYSGYLVGREEDYEWDKYHTSGGGNTYAKKVKNPIKQVGRQTYILSHVLQENGIHGWIEGYAFLAQGKSPVQSNVILLNASQMNRAIHPEKERTLSEKQIRRIADLFHKYMKRCE